MLLISQIIIFKHNGEKSKVKYVIIVFIFDLNMVVKK